MRVSSKAAQQAQKVDLFPGLQLPTFNAQLPTSKSFVARAEVRHLGVGRSMLEVPRAAQHAQKANLFPGPQLPTSKSFAAGQRFGIWMLNVQCWKLRAKS